MLSLKAADICKQTTYINKFKMKIINIIMKFIEIANLVITTQIIIVTILDIQAQLN